MIATKLLARFVGRRLTAAGPTTLSLLLLAALFALSLILPDQVVDRPASAGETQRPALAPARPRRPVTLRDRLIVGLQARTRSEVSFVETVVLRVQAGRIPQRIVDETFFWARARASAKRRGGRSLRPIIYFQPAMAARAGRLRVEL